MSHVSNDVVLTNFLRRRTYVTYINNQKQRKENSTCPDVVPVLILNASVSKVLLCESLYATASTVASY